MGFFTKRERNELDGPRTRTMDEFVPQHQLRTREPPVARPHREPTAGDVAPLLARAAGKSVQDIDDLIDGLQSMRERLNREAARVQGEIVAYTRLSQWTMNSTKVISESLRNSFPTLSPSEEPTLSPSAEPPRSASAGPTLSPSDEPTLEPSEEEPTLSPSPERR
jgi:hypothetical protein